MRRTILSLCFLSAACAAPSVVGFGTALTPADAATSMLAGGAVTMRVASTPASGDDPLNVLTLARADGKSMSFEEANHAPNDVAVQAAGGALANAMGLYGEERPVLYHARTGGTPFICGPEGPTNLGVYSAADGSVSIVGLKSGFDVTPRADGTYDVAPFSPDHICARLRFTKG